MTWQQAQTLLAGTAVGTFLVRDSQKPGYLFSLSVSTGGGGGGGEGGGRVEGGGGGGGGVTSVRIAYARGLFALDCESKLRASNPSFTCVVRLLEHHVTLHREKKTQHVWRDGRGQRECPVVLACPMRVRVPPLQHLCRMRVIAAMGETDAPSGLARVQQLPLPLRLRTFVGEYPYEL
ncbi:PREDICTED: suppressor of cytokine signaling 2-like [Priapulus caudatus]|uniref:Suppressor of cytokine signaling 2-like n=1 Tax=Priapulus caudatus TaxID=37621 RepID=A0ABM1F155_PRICU|nr:PREDICTED: suppressor of cytokine signaling 2-like [Priapulus caudatus]